MSVVSYSVRPHRWQRNRLLCPWDSPGKSTRVGCHCLLHQAALVVKNPPANAGDSGLIPGFGRPPGEGNGNPLQNSCLDNSTDREAWWPTIFGDAKSQTWLSEEHSTFTFLSLSYHSSLPFPHSHKRTKVRKEYVSHSSSVSLFEESQILPCR